MAGATLLYDSTRLGTVIHIVDTLQHMNLEMLEHPP
jgi:hypothetical protein